MSAVARVDFAGADGVCPAGSDVSRRPRSAQARRTPRGLDAALRGQVLVRNVSPAANEREAAAGALGAVAVAGRVHRVLGGGHELGQSVGRGAHLLVEPVKVPLRHG